MFKIYLIYAESGGIGQWKIGVTSNIEQRLLNLKTGNPNIQGIEATYDISDKEIAYKVEALMHKHFMQDRLDGEWFKNGNINKDVFLAVCEKCETNINIWKDFKESMKRSRDKYW